MASNRMIQIVASESTPEKESEYDDWYTEIHIPMLFGYKGMKKVSRYRLIGENQDVARFLTIYEFDSKEDMDDFHSSSAFKEAIEDYENKKDEVDFRLKWAAAYECTKSLER